MRLVSCVGLLMVIPAIALLTHSNERHAATETHQQDKASANVHEKAMHPDSVLLSKVNHLPAQKPLDFTAKRAVKPNPEITDNK